MGERVDATRCLGSYDARLVGAMAATQAVGDVLSQCGWSSRRLLAALLDPVSDAASAPKWRTTVIGVSGATDETEQSSRIKVACEDLVAALTRLPDACRVLERTVEQ